MRAKEGGGGGGGREKKWCVSGLGDGKWELWHIFTKEGGKHCSTSILRGERGGGIHCWICDREFGVGGL